MSQSKTTLNKEEKAYIQRLSHRLVLKYKILPTDFNLQGVKWTPNVDRVCGTFGDVYRGTYQKAQVALKVLRPQGSWTSAMKEEKEKVCEPREILCFRNIEYIEPSNSYGRPSFGKVFIMTMSFVSLESRETPWTA